MSERNGLREHYIRRGDRLIARVDQRELEPVGGGGVITVGRDPRPTRALLLSLLALSLVLFGRAITGSRSRPRARAAAVASLALAAGLVQSGCFLFGASDRPLWENAGTLYFHHGISPGPTLLTREDGTVLEERRYEPFGDDIDALREPAGGGTPTTGAIDFTVDAHNILNKQADPDTGWSYHGARWMAPDSARWLTPDPPVKAPVALLIEEPWSTHPYQYVNQNPIAFWDPDGEGRVGEFGVEGYGQPVGAPHVHGTGGGWGPAAVVGIVVGVATLNPVAGAAAAAGTKVLLENEAPANAPAVGQRTYARPSMVTVAVDGVLTGASFAAAAAVGPIDEFARREGLDVQRLQRWRRRLGDEEGRPTSGPDLIELRPRQAEPVEIVLASGRVLRVAETIDVAALVRLVEAIERP